MLAAPWVIVNVFLTMKPIIKKANGAVIYCRVSTKEQTENLSLPTQRKACEGYCRKNGLTVEQVFVEMGESAKTANRTEFKKLLAYCRDYKSRIAFVVVYNVSRFSRDVATFHVISLQLHQLGIQLRSVTEAFDQSAAGKLMATVLAAMAQHDNDARSDRTKAGMLAAIDAGRWPFKPPLGYARGVHPNGNKNIVPDEDRAALVTKAFELLSQRRFTKRQVLQMVTDLGLRTPKGSKVSPQTFDEMLRKPVYAGWIAVASNERKRGAFQPLVSQDLFDAVQAILDGRRGALSAYNRNHPDFPLRRFVRCGQCRTPMTASWSKGRNARYAYYRCRNPRCGAVEVRREKIETEFIKLLESLTPRPEYLDLFKAVFIDVLRDRQREFAEIKRALQATINEKEIQKQRVIDAFLFEKSISREIYDQKLELIQNELTEVGTKLDDLEADLIDAKSAVSTAEKILADPAKLWQRLDTSEKQRLQKVIFPDGVEFSEGKFGTPVTALIFKLLQPESRDKAALATLTGFEPVLPP
jgi:site-specific DNA recombinase